jgi:aminopeptidase N
MGDTALDVQHYRISVRMDPDTGRLRGRAVVTARATEDVTRFRLELALHADSVSVNGVEAAFWRSRGLAVVVQPRTPVPADGQMRVEVDYHGNPWRAAVTDEYPWMRKNGEQVGAGEPRIAPWWFPADDHPHDKATYDVVGSVPRGRQFVSNGALVSRRDVGRWTRWHWRSAEPMPSYATLFAAGTYRVTVDDGQWSPTYAVSGTLSPAGQRTNLRLLRATPRLVRWLETQFGPYPFGQVGGLVSGTFRNENWSMETQTRPTYPDLRQVSDARALMVHELAHQWFGNSVTPQRWRDIWLNEGFARWAEVRFEETHGGRTGQEWLRAQYRRHPAGTRFWRLRIADPGPDNLFAWAVYDRGAMAVQALRARIGDEDFFALLPLWTEQRRWGTATVADFEALAEQVSGEDLSAFFQAWLVDRRRPDPTTEHGF